MPHGDTCAFCITLASRGWQKASRKSIRNGHAEHIHANCDCTYAIRFNRETTVEGYHPEKYLEMYENAEGAAAKEKINSLRKMLDREANNRKYAGLTEDGPSDILSRKHRVHEVFRNTELKTAFQRNQRQIRARTR